MLNAFLLSLFAGQHSSARKWQYFLFSHSMIVALVKVTLNDAQEIGKGQASH